ncbi:DUF1611 domain-containing protein [Armatimonas sp.]|uniref:DUF1611 domain-containing protein n=1 Tax=Armatimonas sp. TaxID=1872638 RepID=UPI003750D64D
MQLSSNRKLALLMHNAVLGTSGKMGFGLLRYSDSQVTCVIDQVTAGQDLTALTGISRPTPVPIVATIAEALALGADTLVPAIAPAGGILPSDWREEVVQGLRGGMSLVNGLHERMAEATDFRDALTLNAFIWDVRQEPPGLPNGLGRAQELSARRVLTVGTDMAIGKMTASLELHRAAQQRSIPSAFVATGQIGICISGAGIALDAVRVDFASGGVEWAVLEAGKSNPELIWIEGQGSVLHPASTAWLPLIRGSMPTQLILCHRAGQESVMRAAWVKIPPLRAVAALYEAVCAGAGALPGARVVGIALNCAHLTDDEARAACAQTEAQTGLPTQDVVRFGGEKLLEAVLCDKMPS